MRRLWTGWMLVALAPWASACPNCVKGLAAQDAARAERAQQAYNASILLMMGMPFALTSVFGVTFYRLARQSSAASHMPQTPPELPKDVPHS